MEDDSQPAVRNHIFISYRRDDTSGASGRLYDWLRIAFGREQVFLDVHSIGVGNWRDTISDELARSAVCVAVIGRRWANADNLRRLHNEGDMVRHELVNALASNQITVVPTLVEGAEVPKSADLPTVLQQLFGTWNARRVTQDGWEDDTRRLIAEIGKAAGLSAKPDLDTLLHNAGKAQQRIAKLEQDRHLQAEQIDGLRRTVDELTRKLAEATEGERTHLADAVAALARGDSRAAEDAFEREFSAQSLAAEEARKKRAEAARNVANLALLRDVSKAVSFYRKALDGDSEDADTARLLGCALILVGDLKGAEDAFSRSLKSAISQHDSLGEMAAQIGLGDVFRTTRSLDAAYGAYTAAKHLAERALDTDPGSTLWQRELAVSYDRIGGVKAVQGDSAAALKSYQDGLAITKRLADSDPRNTVRQHDLSVNYDMIGDIQAKHGDSAAALMSYQDGLAIIKRLADSDPRNTEWQRDLAVSYDKIGDLQAPQGHSAAALNSYQDALAIRKRLADIDPRNTLWQRDLSLTYDGIGNVQVTQGDSAAALKSYQDSLAIRKRLADNDPSNSRWQHALSVSYIKIGDVQTTLENSAAALKSYQDGHAIAKQFTDHDSSNSEWQHALSVSYDKLGDVQAAKRFGLAKALKSYQDGLDIRKRLAENDPRDSQWQHGLLVSHINIGDVQIARGKSAAALKSYQDG